MVQRSHYSWGGAIALPALACAHALRGAWVDAEDTLDTLMEPGRIFQEVGTSFQTEAWVYRQWLRAYSGETDAVSKRFAANPQLAAVEGPVDVVSLSRFCALVEIGDLIAAPAMVQEPYQALLQAAERDGGQSQESGHRAFPCIVAPGFEQFGGAAADAVRH